MLIAQHLSQKLAQLSYLFLLFYALSLFKVKERGIVHKSVARNKIEYLRWKIYSSVYYHHYISDSILLQLSSLSVYLQKRIKRLSHLAIQLSYVQFSILVLMYPALVLPLKRSYADSFWEDKTQPVKNPLAPNTIGYFSACFNSKSP